MGPIKAVSNKILPKPLTDTGYVDLFAPEAPDAVPSSLHSAESEYSSGSFGNAFSDTLPGHGLDNHPLFRGGRNVIPGVKKSESWMRRNALELLTLHGIEEIAKAKPGAQFVIAALMNATSTEMRGVELRAHGDTKAPGEALLLIEKRHSTVQFLDVDVRGLPAAQAAWFESLPRGHEHSPTENRFIHRSKFSNEVSNQHESNEVAFRDFYGTIGGLDPASFSKLQAWVTLDRGRITYVGALGQLPRTRVGGLRAEFSAAIVGGAAHLSCTDRSLLLGMPSLYMDYFREPFIKVRDVIPAVEEGVPHEEADEVDSNAILGA